MKSKKTTRWDMRVTPELDERTRELSEQLNLSRNELVAQILWTVVHTPSKVFTCCPDCGVAMFDQQRIPNGEGITPVECNNGHFNYFDWEKEAWVEEC